MRVKFFLDDGIGGSMLGAGRYDAIGLVGHGLCLGGEP